MTKQSKATLLHLRLPDYLVLARPGVGVCCSVHSASMTTASSITLGRLNNEHNLGCVRCHCSVRRLHSVVVATTTTFTAAAHVAAPNGQPKGSDEPNDNPSDGATYSQWRGKQKMAEEMDHVVSSHGGQSRQRVSGEARGRGGGGPGGGGAFRRMGGGAPGG